MKSLSTFALAAVASACFTASAVAQNHILNGGFEQISLTLPYNGACPSPGAPSGALSGAACTAEGWTGSYYVANGPTYFGSGASFGVPMPLPDGGQSAILQTFHDWGGPYVQTSVSLPNSGLFVLSFFLANRSYPSRDSAPQTVSVYWDGEVIPGAVFSMLPEMWTKYEIEFSAEAGIHTLSFAGESVSSRDQTAFLDGVSLISAVPEPGVLAMWISGLIGLFGLCARRKAMRP